MVEQYLAHKVAGASIVAGYILTASNVGLWAVKKFEGLGSKMHSDRFSPYRVKEQSLFSVCVCCCC